ELTQLGLLSEAFGGIQEEDNTRPSEQGGIEMADQGALMAANNRSRSTRGLNTSSSSRTPSTRLVAGEEKMKASAEESFWTLAVASQVASYMSILSIGVLSVLLPLGFLLFFAEILVVISLQMMFRLSRSEELLAARAERERLHYEYVVRSTAEPRQGSAGTRPSQEVEMSERPTSADEESDHFSKAWSSIVAGGEERSAGGTTGSAGSRTTGSTQTSFSRRFTTALLNAHPTRATIARLSSWREVSALFSMLRVWGSESKADEDFPYSSAPFRIQAVAVTIFTCLRVFCRGILLPLYIHSLEPHGFLLGIVEQRPEDLVQPSGVGSAESPRLSSLSSPRVHVAVVDDVDPVSSATISSTVPPPSTKILIEQPKPYYRDMEFYSYALSSVFVLGSFLGILVGGWHFSNAGNLGKLWTLRFFGFISSWALLFLAIHAAMNDYSNLIIDHDGVQRNAGDFIAQVEQGQGLEGLKRVAADYRSSTQKSQVVASGRLLSTEDAGSTSPEFHTFVAERLLSS
ncbi:unnamed protein product, partial [Amoebophrya sp. A25]